MPACYKETGLLRSRATIRGIPANYRSMGRVLSIGRVEPTCIDRYDYFYTHMNRYVESGLIGYYIRNMNRT